MSGFSTQDRPSRDVKLQMRMTVEQKEFVEQLANAMSLSASEMMRKALDYWLENCPEAKRAKRLAER